MKHKFIFGSFYNQYTHICLLGPQIAKYLKITAEPDDANFLETITARWEAQKEIADSNLGREIWSTTIKYKGLICKLTSRLVASLKVIEDEVLSNKERNIDNILNRQVIWNREIETWKLGILESAKLVQKYFEEYLPRYQSLLRVAGFYSLEDINAILNRLVLHTNHIIIGNIHTVTNVEMKLKLAYNSIVKDEIIKLYYEVTMERANIPQGLGMQTTDGTEEDTLWKKQIFQDLMLIHEMFKEELPEPTSIPELVHHIDLLDGSMKYLFYYQLDIMKLIYGHIKKIIDEPGDPQEDDKTLSIWKDFISMMKDSIFESKNIVERGLNSWHQTLSRMELVKVMIKAAVDQHRCANVYHEEVEVNILLDKLRDCPELKLLNGYFQRIKTIFEKYEKRINTKHAEELKIISVLPRSFNISRDLFESASNVLIDYTENIELKEANAYKLPVFFDDPNIDQTISKIYRHLQAVKSWRKAFSDTLKMISVELKEIIPNLVGIWNNDMHRDILDWYKHKLDSLYRRKIRIKTDIVDVRAAELQDHHLRLKRHIAGIYDNYDKLSKLENVRESLARINEELDEELNKEQTLSLLNALRIHEQYKKMKKKIDENRTRKAYLIKREIENVERLFHWMAAANKNFLKSIRFFGENGNFSPKEAQIAVIALQRVEGLMPIMKSQIIKSIKEVEGEFRIKPTILTQKEDLKLMMRKRVELDFKEQVVVEISQLRGLLIEEAQKVMKSIKTLESKTRDVNSWRPEILKSLLNSLQALALYLSLPEFMKKLEIEVPPTREPERTYDKKEMMVAIARNYAQDLHTGAPFPPSFNQENFMYKTKSYLNNSINKLQKSARIFFFKTKEEKRRKVGAMTPAPNRVLYRNFMENILSIFKGYNLQCERIWLEYILDFLSIIHLIHDRFMNFIIKMLKSTWVWWKLKLKALNDNYTNTYDTLTNEADEERSALKYELKPWLGYPDKKPKLPVLAKKATEHCRQLVRILCQEFQQFKNDAKSIMKNVFLISTQLFMKLKVLKSVMIEHRGLQLIFTNTAKFIDRFAKEFFDSQRHAVPGSAKKFQADFLLEPGGRSRLWSIPKTTVLTISEPEIDSPVSTMEVVPPAQSSDNILKAAMEVEVEGMLFKTGFTTNIELISDLARLLKTISNVPLKFNPDLVTTADEKEKMNEFLHFDLEKKVLSLKRIFRNKCRYYITKHLRNLDLLIRQLEKWHSDWNHDFKEINKLYEPDPFYD